MKGLEEAEEAHSLGMSLARTKLIDQQVVFPQRKILSRAIKTKISERHLTQLMITIGRAVTTCREVILMRILIASLTT